jgi:hypothetical protein
VDTKRLKIDKKTKQIAIARLQRDALSFLQVRMEAHDLGVTKENIHHVDLINHAYLT